MDYAKGFKKGCPPIDMKGGKKGSWSDAGGNTDPPDWAGKNGEKGKFPAFACLAQKGNKWSEEDFSAQGSKGKQFEQVETSDNPAGNSFSDTWDTWDDGSDNQNSESADTGGPSNGDRAPWDTWDTWDAMDVDTQKNEADQGDAGAESWDPAGKKGCKGPTLVDLSGNKGIKGGKKDGDAGWSVEEPWQSPGGKGPADFSGKKGFKGYSEKGGPMDDWEPGADSWGKKGGKQFDKGCKKGFEGFPDKGGKKGDDASWDTGESWDFSGKKGGKGPFDMGPKGQKGEKIDGPTLVKGCADMGGKKGEKGAWEFEGAKGDWGGKKGDMGGKKGEKGLWDFDGSKGDKGSWDFSGKKGGKFGCEFGGKKGDKGVWESFGQKGEKGPWELDKGFQKGDKFMADKGAPKGPFDKGVPKGEKGDKGWPDKGGKKGDKKGDKGPPDVAAMKGMTTVAGSPEEAISNVPPPPPAGVLPPPPAALPPGPDALEALTEKGKGKGKGKGEQLQELPVPAVLPPPLPPPVPPPIVPGQFALDAQGLAEAVDALGKLFPQGPPLVHLGVPPPPHPNAAPPPAPPGLPPNLIEQLRLQMTQVEGTSGKPCHFGRSCKKLDCADQHNGGRDIEDDPESLVCRFGRKCKRGGCFYLHPAGRELEEDASKGMCKFGKDCTKAECIFAHPDGRAPVIQLRCHSCGEVGHIQRDCPSNKDNRICRFCGLAGHLQKDCPSGGGRARRLPPGTYVTMSGFSEQLMEQGTEKLAAYIQGELEVFGQLVAPPEVVEDGRRVIAAFSDADLARQAVQQLNGTVFTIEFCSNPAAFLGVEKGSTVLVRGFPQRWSSSDVNGLLRGAVGKSNVLNIDVITPEDENARGEAKLHFGSVADARRAYEELQGQKIAGKPLSISMEGDDDAFALEDAPGNDDADNDRRRDHDRGRQRSRSRRGGHAALADGAVEDSRPRSPSREDRRHKDKEKRRDQQSYTIHIDELDMPRRPEIAAAAMDSEVWVDPLPDEPELGQWLAAFGPTIDVFPVKDELTGKSSHRGYVKFKEHSAAEKCVVAGAAKWSESERTISSQASSRGGRESAYHESVVAKILGPNGELIRNMKEELGANQLILRGEGLGETDRMTSLRVHFVCRGPSSCFTNLKEVLEKRLAEIHDELRKKADEPQPAQKQRSRSRHRGGGNKRHNRKRPRSRSRSRSPWVPPPDPHSNGPPPWHHPPPWHGPPGPHGPPPGPPGYWPHPPGPWMPHEGHPYPPPPWGPPDAGPWHHPPPWMPHHPPPGHPPGGPPPGGPPPGEFGPPPRDFGPPPGWHGSPPPREFGPPPGGPPPKESSPPPGRLHEPAQTGPAKALEDDFRPPGSFSAPPGNFTAAPGNFSTAPGNFSTAPAGPPSGPPGMLGREREPPPPVAQQPPPVRETPPASAPPGDFLSSLPPDLTPPEHELKKAVVAFLRSWAEKNDEGKFPNLVHLGSDKQVRNSKTAAMPPEIALRAWLERRLRSDVVLARDSNGKTTIHLASTG